MKKLILNIFSLLSKSKTLYTFSKKIVDYYRNENNCEIETNGEMDFIRKNKDSFKIIFDVGANIGEWTSLVSQIVPQARIYSFEPSRQTFNTLSSNKYSNMVSLHNIGLGEKNETVDFFIYGKDSTLNSAFSRDVNITESINDIQKEKVKFESLDNFCEGNKIEKISFLKIDVEGNELSVLKGAEKYISAGKVDYIQFEYGGTFIDAHILLKDVFEFFKNKPYTISKMMSSGLKTTPTYSREFENFQYANYVAILKK